MLVLPAEAGKDALAKGLQMMWEVAGVFPSTTLGEQKRGFPSRFPSEAECSPSGAEGENLLPLRVVNPFSYLWGTNSSHPIRD